MVAIELLASVLHMQHGTACNSKWVGNTAVCTYLLTVSTSSDSVYLCTAIMAYLMMYNDEVISERCSGFTMQVTYS